MKLHTVPHLFLLICVVAVRPTSAEDAVADGAGAEGIDFFESHVRPVLVKRCYECHSAKSDPIEGGFRLDSLAAWRSGGDSGVAIVPGKPDESRVLKAVLYQDPTLAMPPDSALPKREIDVLRQWIAMGAPDPRTESTPLAVREVDLKKGRQFWAFRPIRDPQLPRVANRAWAQSPIDQFVLARLEERGLKPVRQATRQKLIRRAFFDVLGLPPSPEEVQAFLDDRSPDAWPQLVDRLLASPRYGERWGRHWLDVARYADDQLKEEFYYRPLPHAWRYRDWVVRAFNDDLPYDQFVTQQLAGDILVNTSGAEATTATGFLGLGMIYQDDGATPESIAIAKAETTDDKMDTVTRGLLGLTVSCARCHDHKFDPIPTEDYYSLAGIFENTQYVENADADGYQVHAMAEGGDQDMRVALRGNRLKPGKIAPRRFLRVIAGDDPPRFQRGSGRLELAQAIANPENPLTPRVIANRVWQHHFGRGIVASASNFGMTGERPTHPRLLDWLACRLTESGWSLKALHREILLSSTYQLDTQFNEPNARVDGDNRWLWRMNRRRLDIETYRDNLLSVSEELDRRIGGPPEADLLSSQRRTIYGAVRRDQQNAGDELLHMFDFPNPRLSSSGRTSTTTTGQQLFTLNSQFVIERSRAFAARTHGDVHQAFWLAFGREPRRAELALADSFVVGDSGIASDALSLWEQYCQVLLISNESMFRP